MILSDIRPKGADYFVPPREPWHTLGLEIITTGAGAQIYSGVDATGTTYGLNDTIMFSMFCDFSHFLTATSGPKWAQLYGIYGGDRVVVLHGYGACDEIGQLKVKSDANPYPYGGGYSMVYASSVRGGFSPSPTNALSTPIPATPTLMWVYGIVQVKGSSTNYRTYINGVRMDSTYQTNVTIPYANYFYYLASIGCVPGERLVTSSLVMHNVTQYGNFGFDPYDINAARQYFCTSDHSLPKRISHTPSYMWFQDSSNSLKNNALLQNVVFVTAECTATTRDLSNDY